MKIERFEEIKAWQESKKLANMIYDALDSNNDFRLKSQMTSAAVSIMSNIAEGFARQTNKEFTQFLFISKGSISELQSQLYVALDRNYINKQSFDEIYRQSDLVARLISRFITYLKGYK